MSGNQTGRPNVVMIVGDNHGRGAVGCYGQTGGDFETPNIDRLAADGLRFSNYFCSNAYCSGSRATLLSGLMPSQHGVHSWLQDTGQGSWPDDWFAVGEFRTLPATLHDRGYRTAHVGKWHLGTPWRAAPGFDSWVAFALGDTLDFYDNEVVIDDQRSSLKGRHIVDFFSEQAVERLQSLSEQPEPFFLSVWYDGPYALPPTNLGADPRNPFYEQFAGREFNSVPRCAVDPDLIRLLQLEELPDEDYRSFLWDIVRMQNDLPSLANFASQCALVDQGVGQIVDAIDALGLAEDTLVIYTTDQGNLFGQHGAWGHASSFVPTKVYDDLMCIPLICRQPGTIQPGGVCDRLIGQYDIAPTITDWVGFDHVRYADSPGVSFAPALAGTPQEDDRDAVFFEQEETRAIHTGKFAYWKRCQGLGQYWRRIGYEWSGDPVLYDMEHDPTQSRNVAADPAYAGVCADLDRRIDAFFADHVDSRYDLWQGGTAKGSIDFPIVYREAYGSDWQLEIEARPIFQDDQA